MTGMQEEVPATIKVFREDSVWDTVEKAWQLSDANIQRLYVETWHCAEETVSLSDARFVRQAYAEPVVLVYVGPPEKGGE